MTFPGNVDNPPGNRCLNFGDVLTSEGTLTFDLPKPRPLIVKQPSMSCNLVLPLVIYTILLVPVNAHSYFYVQQPLLKRERMLKHLLHEHASFWVEIPICGEMSRSPCAFLVYNYVNLLIPQPFRFCMNICFVFFLLKCRLGVCVAHVTQNPQILVFPPLPGPGSPTFSSCFVS